MKRIRGTIAQIISGVLLAVLVSGCGRSDLEERSTGKPAADESGAEEGSYGELIQQVRDCIAGKEGEGLTAGEDFSIALLTCGSYGIPGYLEEDINGDGTSELIFGVTGTDPALSDTWDGVIYDIYTISDGKIVHVLNGWERNRYYLCENGMLANEGASGASDFSYSYYTFDGVNLHLKESVIYDGVRDEEQPWFYLAGGSDSAESGGSAEDAEPISETRAEEIREKYVYTHPAFIPLQQLSALQPSESAQSWQETN